MRSSSTNEYVGYVYKITNKINEKIYIGETLLPIEKRFKQHCKDAYKEVYSNYYFYRAIRKHKPENFVINELEKVSGADRKLVKKQILELEEKYVLKYNSFNCGYNSNSGGRCPLQVREETKKLQRKIKLENPNTNTILEYARTFHNIERKVTAYNFTTGERVKTFDSIKEASEYYNIDSSGITKVCKKSTNYLGTLNNIKITWRYAEDFFEVPYTIKVYDESGNLLNKFVNFADAAKFYNIKHQETISRCCNGKSKCTGRKKGEKLIWRFINDDFKLQ